MGRIHPVRVVVLADSWGVFLKAAIGEVLASLVVSALVLAIA